MAYSHPLAPVLLRVRITAQEAEGATGIERVFFAFDSLQSPSTL